MPAEAAGVVRHVGVEAVEDADHRAGRGAVPRVRLSPQGTQSGLSRRSTSITARVGVDLDVDVDRHAVGQARERVVAAARLRAGRSAACGSACVHAPLGVVEPLARRTARASRRRSLSASSVQPPLADARRADRRQVVAVPLSGTRIRAPAHADDVVDVLVVALDPHAGEDQRALLVDVARVRHVGASASALPQSAWCALAQAVNTVLAVDEHRHEDRVVGGVRVAEVRVVVEEGVALARGRGCSSRIDARLQVRRRSTWTGRPSADGEQLVVGGDDRAREVARGVEHRRAPGAEQRVRHLADDRRRSRLASTRTSTASSCDRPAGAPVRRRRLALDAPAGSRRRASRARSTRVDDDRRRRLLDDRRPGDAGRRARSVPRRVDGGVCAPARRAKKAARRRRRALARRPRDERPSGGLGGAATRRAPPVDASRPAAGLAHREDALVGARGSSRRRASTSSRRREALAVRAGSRAPRPGARSGPRRSSSIAGRGVAAPASPAPNASSAASDARRSDGVDRRRSRTTRVVGERRLRRPRRRCRQYCAAARRSARRRRAAQHLAAAELARRSRTMFSPRGAAAGDQRGSRAGRRPALTVISLIAATICSLATVRTASRGRLARPSPSGSASGSSSAAAAALGVEPHRGRRGSSPGRGSRAPAAASVTVGRVAAAPVARRARDRRRRSAGRRAGARRGRPRRSSRRRRRSLRTSTDGEPGHVAAKRLAEPGLARGHELARRGSG